MATVVLCQCFERGDISVHAAWFALLLAAALLLWRLGIYEPQAGGSGIPQIKGVILGVLRLRWLRVLWVKLVGGIVGIGLGLSLGREGPSIQIGAVAAQGMSRLFGRTRMEERYLITAGASAGLAAAFNAPLAGVMFALEELHRNFFRCRPGTGHGSGFDGDHGQSLPFWTGTGFSFRHLAALSSAVYVAGRNFGNHCRNCRGDF